MKTLVGKDRRLVTFSTRWGTFSNDVIVVVMVTLTLTFITSRLADAAGHLDVDRQRSGRHGGRTVVTWYDDVTAYRHNSVLQHDDPIKLEEVLLLLLLLLFIYLFIYCYCYYYYYSPI